MRKTRFLTIAASVLAASSLFASTALADEMVPVAADGAPRPGNTFTVGEAANLSIGAAEGAGELFTIAYPGNSAPVVINARIDGVGNTILDTVGFDVYDEENVDKVVEHVTLGTNMFNKDPNLMMFAYSSAKGQTVKLKFFNWSHAPVTLQVMPVQMDGMAITDAGPAVEGQSKLVGISAVAGVRIGR